MHSNTLQFIELDICGPNVKYSSKIILLTGINFTGIFNLT